LESVDGVRTVAQSRDRSVGESFLSADPVGRPVMITDPGEFAPA
jgi:hypothetical protein